MKNFNNINKIKMPRGFSLLEIMVVIFILGLLVSLVAPNVLQNQDKALIRKTQADLSQLESALDLYRLDNFNYPTTEQGLAALVSKPTAEPIPDNYNPGGYIKKLPKDPWGSDYQYEFLGDEGGNNDYKLFSLGKDRKLNNDDKGDDILSQSSEK